MRTHRDRCIDHAAGEHENDDPEQDLPAIALLAEDFKPIDDLRSYIVSSMIYPSLLACVGFASVFILLNFVVPRFSQVFVESRMKIPLPTCPVANR